MPLASQGEWAGRVVVWSAAAYRVRYFDIIISYKKTVYLVVIFTNTNIKTQP